MIGGFILVIGILSSMVVLVPCKDILDYEIQLTTFITETITVNKNITFIDCRNSIHPYLFKKKDLSHIVDHLFITHIARLDDFIEQLERIAADPYFKQSDVLLVSSYIHFIYDMSVSEQRHFVQAITRMLIALERRHQISVVFIDINSRWGLLFNDHLWAAS